MIAQDGYVMMHAGLMPQWTISDALAYAGEVEAVLQSDSYTEFFNKYVRKCAKSMAGRFNGY